MQHLNHHGAPLSLLQGRTNDTDSLGPYAKGVYAYLCITSKVTYRVARKYLRTYSDRLLRLRPMARRMCIAFCTCTAIRCSRRLESTPLSGFGGTPKSSQILQGRTCLPAYCLPSPSFQLFGIIHVNYPKDLEPLLALLEMVGTIWDYYLGTIRSRMKVLAVLAV